MEVVEKKIEMDVENFGKEKWIWRRSFK